MQRKNYVNILELKKRVDRIIDILQEKGVLNAAEAIALYEPQNNKPGKPGKPATAKNKSVQASSHPQRSAEKENLHQGSSSDTAHGHLAGTVYDRQSGKPLTGVHVILKRGQDNAELHRYRTTKSDMEGRFFFLNLPLERQHTGNGNGVFRYSLEMIYRQDNFTGSGFIQLTSDQTTIQDLFLEPKTE